MRRVLYYGDSSDRYYYARFDVPNGYLELGSSRLLGNHLSFHPEEIMRLVVAGSGENPYSKMYLTPRYALHELSVRFEKWLSNHKNLQLKLDVRV